MKELERCRPSVGGIDELAAVLLVWTGDAVVVGVPEGTGVESSSSCASRLVSICDGRVSRTRPRPAPTYWTTLLKVVGWRL
jgi:hypothetical protein